MRQTTKQFSILAGACLTGILLLISASAADMPPQEATSSASSKWVVFAGASGKPGSGKYIVLVAGDDDKTLFIKLDGLVPAWVVEMQLTLYNPDNVKIERKLHGGIFELGH